jgi:hypothetical protein
MACHIKTQALSQALLLWGIFKSKVYNGQKASPCGLGFLEEFGHCLFKSSLAFSTLPEDCDHQAQ